MKISTFQIKYVLWIIILCCFYISLVPALCIDLDCKDDFKILFKENRLYVDGKPFFFFGIDGVVGNLASMKKHHVNTIFS